MLGREGDECHSEDGIRPSGECSDAGLGANYWKIDVRAVGSPYPVTLHRLDVLREGDVVEFFEQFVGVLGHVQEPLHHVPLHDLEAAAPAAVVLDLFVGEHGVAVHAPVDRCHLVFD
uniref:Uncharacterized protein n=1 Tax=uncultured marine group II/III euryarchaeote KM3_196_E05 TaxID=1457971 RepID=A0A075GV59_9EURY|nr:hypothetical protein [uncultured marine group II/III euryarchaeote KM3_196_E05]